MMKASSKNRQPKQRRVKDIQETCDEERTGLTKKLVGDDVVLRNIAARAFKSPALLTISTPRKFEDGCPWGCGAARNGHMGMSPEWLHGDEEWAHNGCKGMGNGLGRSAWR